MENCIFCKIIAGDIPSSKVYEDDQALAFLDISQTTKGHTLLIPKEHVRNVLAMSQGTSETLFARLPKVARAVQKATGAVGMNILNNNEEVAGQTVFHAHVTSSHVMILTTKSHLPSQNTNLTLKRLVN